MKTKHIFAFVACLLGAVALYAAGPGETCSTAIPLDKEGHYSANISGPQTIWYTAWTFDLPLAVYFKPQNETDPAPEVEMDFSCTTGVYTDSIICSLFCPNSGSGIQIDMPHKPKLETDRIDGELVYYIVMGKKYRDLLLQVGISYNVQVFVKVTYKSKGSISIAPDNMFSSCMDGARFMHLGDSVRVKAKDKDTHVIVPYVQWQYDSIYYIWRSPSGASATITVGSDCRYDPTDGSDESILQRMQNVKSGDTVKVTSEKITHYVKFEDNEAGMFFAKCYSSAEGMLTIKQVPQAPPRGGATLMKYDQRVVINAKDTNALFAMPASWDTATIFTTPTDHIFRMYISTEPDFYLKDALKSYQFLPSDKGHWWGIPDDEMKALWANTTEKYLYVRFSCSARTTLLPEMWNPSECMSAPLLNKGKSTLTIEKYSSGAKVYRFYYNAWKNGKMTLQWNLNTNSCDAYIGDTCSFKPKDTDPHMIATKTIAKRGGKWDITPEMFEQWKDRVDPEGYIYLLIYTEARGEMVISTTAPDETDPVFPHTTIHVECADGANNFVASVSEAQHISVTSTSGTVDEWEAVPGESHALTLPSGQYLLKGAKDEITIQVP